MLVQPRWWDAVMAAGLLACAVLLATSGAFARDPIAWATLIAFALVYLLLARPQFTRRDGPVTPTLLACGVLTALLLGIAVYRYPALATLQCVAYPMVWTLPWRLRSAIFANLGIGAAVFLGYGLSPANAPGATGGAGVPGQSGESGLEVWLTALGIAVLSVVFSLVLGIWISNIAHYGNERAQLLEQLTAAQDELAAMHRQAGETSERARFARELHDTVTQSLTGLVMLAERAGTQLRTERATDARESVALIESTAREALAEARALVATITPVSGDSLAEALRRLAQRFERETGVAVETRVCEHRIAREKEVVLLRCAQEGLANVRKHAHARRVVIEVAGGERVEGVGDDEPNAADDAPRGAAGEASTEAQGGALTLTVRDDGVGIRSGVSEEDGGFGISGMRERVGMLGGRLTLGTPAGGGAELTVVIPAGVA